MKIGRWLEIEEGEYSLDTIKSRLKIPNPEYVSRVQQGFSVAGIPRFEQLYEEATVRGKKVLRVPRGLVNRYGYGRDVVDETSTGHPADFKLKLSLGPNEFREEDQTDFVDTVVAAAEEKYGAIGQASPGYGKTICSLAIVAKLGRTTAILVHKSFLLNQWIERIKSSFDINEDEIGIIQQDKCEYLGKKVVLIMAQSLLSSREYPPDMYEYFGTVVVDEVHRFGATEFRKAITKFPARYRVGVTATPKRKDGLEAVFFMHIGDIAFVGSKRKLTADVKFVDSDVIITDAMLKGMKNYQRKFDLNKVTQYLVDYDVRNRQIIKLAIEALKAGRKIILLSSRREHLNNLAELFEAETAKQGVRYTYGYYVGGMGEEELNISSTRHFILATYQMAQEGLDIPDLDTLFLTTPKGDVIQAVGRILRQHEGKKQPMVIDFVERRIPMSNRLMSKRLSQYKEMGCTILK